MGDDSTLDDVRRSPSGGLATWGRRGGMLVLLAIVVAGGIGVFGVHSRTVTRTGNGYTLSVVYPQTARAGLDVPWRAIVRHPGGFADDVTIAVSTDYFRMFETQGFYSDPDTQHNDGKFVYFEYDKPPGDQFVLDYDAYIQPSSQIGKSATVQLIVGSQVMAQASLRTWLVP